MSLLSACACTLLKGRVVRALKIVRWCDGIEFFCPKKERENLCFLFLEKKIDRQSGFSRIEREKREKMSSLQKDDYDDDEKMKAKEERSKRRRK